MKQTPSLKQRFLRVLPYLAVIAIGYFLLPLAGRDTGTFMVILLAAVPALCFSSGLLFGMRHGMEIMLPIGMAILFVPTLWIYFNSSAWSYTFIYASVGLIANVLGDLFRKKTNE